MRANLSTAPSSTSSGTVLSAFLFLARHVAVLLFIPLERACTHLFLLPSRLLFLILDPVSLKHTHLVYIFAHVTYISLLTSHD